MLKKVLMFCKDCLTAIIIGFSLFGITLFFVRVGNIPSESMLPTFFIGDKVLGVNVKFCDIRRGDIIVFKPNTEEMEEKNELWVKRLIGKPNDKVEIDHGKVTVNGKALKERYIEYNKDYSGTFVVPEDRYLMLGDNRANSADSRFWVNPYIHIDQAKYVVKLKVYPTLEFYTHND